MILHYTCPLGTIHDATVSNVTPKGTYRVQSRDGTCGMDVNDPDAVSLTDDEGNPVNPMSLTSQKTTDEQIAEMSVTLNKATETLQQTEYVVMLLSLGY